MKKETNNTSIHISATPGDLPGEVDLLWDPIPYAKMYVIESGKKYSKRRKIVDITTNSNYTITGLKPNTNYVFRVAVINEKGQGPWSREAEKKSK